MIDTHCHLTFEQLHKRVDQVLSDAATAGVDRMITVGTTPDDAIKAIGLAQRYSNVYAAVGVHPHYADQFTDEVAFRQTLDELASQRGVVALGEMGLDRHYPDPPIEDQKRVLRWQLEWAAGDTRPIIIHNREATDETIALLKESGIPEQRFVFHCFTGDACELDQILEFGAMVSFTGIVTFKSASALADCAMSVPDDRLMVETDSPYLTPDPHRKVRPNEPQYVVWVARFLAEKRNTPVAQFIEMMDRNAERFFGLPSSSDVATDGAHG